MNITENTTPRVTGHKCAEGICHLPAKKCAESAPAETPVTYFSSLTADDVKFWVREDAYLARRSAA